MNILTRLIVIDKLTIDFKRFDKALRYLFEFPVVASRYPSDLIDGFLFEAVGVRL